jgi:hypothetical protein
MNAPSKINVCRVAPKIECKSPRSVFAAEFEKRFEGEMPNYNSVPKEIRKEIAVQGTTAYMQYPEWDTSGAI